MNTNITINTEANIELTEQARKDFTNLREAFKANDVFLVNCARESDGNVVPVICAIVGYAEGTNEPLIVPVAEMVGITDERYVPIRNITSEKGQEG